LNDWGGSFFANFSLAYEKKLDEKEQRAKYEDALVKYRARWDKYIKKKLKYDSWKRDKDIAEMQAKLDKMKAKA